MEEKKTSDGVQQNSKKKRSGLNGIYRYLSGMDAKNYRFNYA
jgi:hypothetical protein